MLHGQRIIFVSIVDNDNESNPNMNIRIYHHQKLVRNLLKENNCLIGRKTFDLTNWKGPNVWVLTRNRNWKRSNVGTIHDLDDLHLHIDGPIFVLGGSSLYHQLSSFVDEIHLYVLNNNKGTEPWIKIDTKEWEPDEYLSKDIWSYVHLKKLTKK
jgi:dihydrofolate reductase